MISLMDSLKMWINIMFPRIEDGDTFGVSVQEGEFHCPPPPPSSLNRPH